MADTYEQRLQALFAAALEQDETTREAWLTQACGSDASLCEELRGLLEADARLRDTTARPMLGSLAQLLEPPASLSGRRVGAWELREEIGRGGMGTVHRVERADGNVRQSGAIKFLHRELLDSATLRRFQLERQVLATLDHPHIARLLDAGQLDDGTPYYVMEFVHGVPITAYCERERLDVRARVALMRKVCTAVSEAHRELIVHRDLKPGNILVDEAGNPKLLDFGIAKPLRPMAGALNEQTGTAQRFFSPHYAAPEQLSGAPVGVACDVYALGLLLYEVLSGMRPFEFEGLSPGQIERLVREVPPPAPSHALARRDAADVRVRQLRGDLDGIVLRCLRKLPAERYASVEQLEAELCSYLEGRPVQARGGQLWYRVQKFVLRNKLGVAAGALLAASLLGGLAAFAWQARIAKTRAAELEQVASFQADMLSQVDPTQAGKLLRTAIEQRFAESLERAALPASERSARSSAFAQQWETINATDAARDLIDGAIVKPAVAALDARFAGQPLVAAKLKQTLAERYVDWGLTSAAKPLQEQALEVRRTMLGELHPDTLASKLDMSLLLRAQGDYPAAEQYLREVYAEHRRRSGAEARDTLNAMNQLGEVLSERHNVEALPLMRESLEIHRRVFGADAPETLTALFDLGGALRQHGNLAEAETRFREALAGRRRVLGSDHSLTIAAISAMGSTLREEAKFDEAEAYIREQLERRRRVSGEAHPDTFRALNALATLYNEQGKTEQAETLSREVLEKSRHLLGENHPDTVLYITNLAFFYQRSGRNEEADPLMAEALEKRRKLFGPDSPEALRTAIALGTLRISQWRVASAVELLTSIEAAGRRVFIGDNVYQLGKLHYALGVARIRLGEFDAARANLEEALAEFGRSAMTRDEDKADCAAAYAVLYTRLDTAEPGKGYAAQAAEQIRKAHQLDPTLPPIHGAEVPDEKH